MNSFKNFVEQNKESIKLWLRRDMISDLIIRDYTTIKKDYDEIVVYQDGFSFYLADELKDYSIDKNDAIKVLSNKDPKKELYAVAGRLLDQEEDVITENLNTVLDNLIKLVLDEGYEACRWNKPCKVRGYYSDNFYATTMLTNQDDLF